MLLCVLSTYICLQTDIDDSRKIVASEIILSEVNELDSVKACIIESIDEEVDVQRDSN